MRETGGEYAHITNKTTYAIYAVAFIEWCGCNYKVTHFEVWVV